MTWDEFVALAKLAEVAVNVILTLVVWRLAVVVHALAARVKALEERF